MEEKAAIILVTLGILLILGNMINLLYSGGKADVGFWLRIASAVLLLMAMLITLRTQQKKKQ